MGVERIVRSECDPSGVVPFYRGVFSIRVQSFGDCEPTPEGSYVFRAC